MSSVSPPPRRSISSSKNTCYPSSTIEWPKFLRSKSVSCMTATSRICRAESLIEENTKKTIASSEGRFNRSYPNDFQICCDISDIHLGRGRRGSRDDSSMRCHLKDHDKLLNHHKRSLSADSVVRSVAPPWTKPYRQSSKFSRSMSLPADGQWGNLGQQSAVSPSGKEDKGEMFEYMEQGMRKAALAERSGEISLEEKLKVKEMLFQSCFDGDHVGVYKVLHSLVLSEESSENSEESGCSSDENVDSEGPVSMKQSVFKGRVLNEKAYKYAHELLATQKKTDAQALSWSVKSAAIKGVISEQLQGALLSVIRRGALREVRDVLYHKCHLVPAVHPASVSKPRPQDRAINQALSKVITRVSPIDSVEERHHKLTVLLSLSNRVDEWIEEIGRRRGLLSEQIAVNRGALFVAGSYRLGLNDRHSDIDVVCVVPWHVTREDFFDSFYRLLCDLPSVSSIAAVPHAFVPLMSIVYKRVPFDILFARWTGPCVFPNQDIDADYVLAGMDIGSVKSLNAPRVATLILSLVPDRGVYRTVLRAVRIWARHRGIYSSKLGYLGGISWSILVAFVCQLYPTALPSTVLTRFFQVMLEWQWPQPIMLSMVYDAGLGFDMWDPSKNLFDRAHIMPIITPAYPQMNSAVQVSQATFSIIYEEFWRACGCADLAMKGEETWETLFLESNFFVRYDWYLVVDFQAANNDDMHNWGKFVESRLRKLVESLQHINSVTRVHAFPTRFESTSYGTKPGQCLFIALEFGVPLNSPRATEKENLNATVRFFLATDLQQWPNRSDGMQASTRLVSWNELPDFVFSQGRSASISERREIERIRKQQQPQFMFTQQQVSNYRPMRGGGRHNNGSKYGNRKGNFSR